MGQQSFDCLRTTSADLLKPGNWWFEPICADLLKPVQLVVPVGGSCWWFLFVVPIWWFLLVVPVWWFLLVVPVGGSLVVPLVVPCWNLQLQAVCLELGYFGTR